MQLQEKIKNIDSYKIWGSNFESLFTKDFPMKL